MSSPRRSSRRSTPARGTSGARQPIPFGTPRTPGSGIDAGSARPNGPPISPSTGTGVPRTPVATGGSSLPRTPLTMGSGTSLPRTPLALGTGTSMPPTPFSMRSDIRGGSSFSAFNTRVLRTATSSLGVQHPSSGSSLLPMNIDTDQVRSGDTEPGRRVIYGTNVNSQETLERFTTFFEEFKETPESQPKYLTLLRETMRNERYNVNVNCQDMFEFDPGLYQQLVNWPGEVISLFDLAVQEIFTRVFPDHMTSSPIQVRLFNLREVKQLRALDPTDIDRLVSVRGMINRCSVIIPDLREAHFRCTKCHFTSKSSVYRGRITEPTRCEHCGGQHTMEMIHNMSAFANKQSIKMQETPESIPEGGTPQNVTLLVFEDLCDIAKPGDRVEITAIFRSAPIRINPRMRTVSTLSRTWFDVIHFRKADTKRFDAENPEAAEDSEYYTRFDETDRVVQFSPEKEAELRALAADPSIMDKLVTSLAPSIWEMDDVKKGILCQLFGGVNKEFSQSGSGRFRGEINVLLVGDPGTAKSQLLQYVYKIAPRGIYTSGKGSSGVGLTASVTRDPDTDDFVLESGALVLSDRGVCCIDEFDKMTDDARAMLHEAMEQQTVSIAKAGIIASLNARTSVLAAANPVGSRYDPNRAIVENINLPPSLLSRFDLIFLILDHPNEQADAYLARHLVGLHREQPQVLRHDIPIARLTEYISFARQRIHPRITDDAGTDLINSYVELRKLAGNDKNCVTATPRQLESLIRISESLARMRFSELVTREDVAEAGRLLRDALLRAATDPVTGKLDMNLISTGATASMIQRAASLQALIEEVLRTDVRTNFARLMGAVAREGGIPVTEEEVKGALRKLQADEKVVIYGSFNAVRKISD